MSKIALIWEEVPEKTSVYVFDTQDDRDICELCNDAHGHYINSNDNDAVDRLNAILTNETPVYTTEGSQKKIEGPFSAICICGFVL